jgi:hypothetical protein
MLQPAGRSDRLVSSSNFWKESLNMWKTLPALAGLGLFLTLPVLAGEPAKQGIIPGKPCIPTDDSITKTVFVEIRGKLIYPKYFRTIYPPKDFVTINVGSKTGEAQAFVLEFADSKLDALAQKLSGQTVVVKGRLELRKYPSLIYLPTFPKRPTYETRQVVVVTSIEPVESDYVHRTEHVEIKGTLTFDPSKIMRPYGVSQYITVKGQRYYLHFGKNAGLQKLAGKLTGETVVVTGTLDRTQGMNIVHVTGLSVTFLASGDVALPSPESKKP